MSPKGRPRNPDAVGHRSAPGEGNAIEVMPVESRLLSIEAPSDMAPVAAEMWAICLTDMAQLGHLREPDLLLLRAYCETAGIMVEAMECVREFGSMMKEPITAMDLQICETVLVGYKLKPNPAVKQHGEAMTRLRLLSSELALNPLARIRGNLMEAATSSIAMSVLDDLEKKLDALDSKESAKIAKQAVATKAAATKKKASKVDGKPKRSREDGTYQSKKSKP